MAIAYPDVLSLRTDPKPVSWTERDLILYALGLGYGSDPLDADELRFVYEQPVLKVVPTAAAILSFGAAPTPAQIGINYLMVVHGEQALRLHRAIPLSGEATKQGRIVAVYDKGAKGAVITTETELRLTGGELIATAKGTIFARADGGFGGPAEGAPVPHVRPERKADVTIEIPTRPGQALLYRLSGDPNPLHADPEVARKAGFERPILHGMCTYGITCRALLKGFGIEPEELVSHAARFSAPVTPGETIVVDLWHDGDVINFEARVAERDVVVLRNGRAEVHAR